VGKSVPQNIVGPVVRKIRYGKGWTQAMLAARCARAGWDIWRKHHFQNRGAGSLRD